MNGILKSHRWTREKKALLEKLRKDGAEWDVISELCGHSIGSCMTTLSKIRKARRLAILGSPPPRKSREPWLDWQVTEMLHLREQEDMLWHDIDKRLGKSPGCSCSKYNSILAARRMAEVKVERVAYTYLTHTSPAAELLGDPLPGRSALDKRNAGIVDVRWINREQDWHDKRQAKITLPGAPLR